MQTVIVFSHLRWDFVYQRPQHLLSRLASHYRILFFEEPVRGNRTPFLQRMTPCPNVEVLRPHTTVDEPGFHTDQLPELSLLLTEYLQDFSIEDYLVWFYTPMALPLLADLRPRAVIYDCMDELAAFKGAPSELAQLEAALMRRAHLVLTGGPSLYQAKRDLHSNVHCFPSAVDGNHFMPPERRNGALAGAKAAEQAARLHEKISRPRLGFFGVIDERFDTDLISAVADSAPEWQLVMVGPVVKIDLASLPKNSNIHWLGQQQYELLPHLVAQWDVCLLPFALNESTRFISPTKTLEYMAAEKPIVSTPIRDVVGLYGDCVAIASGRDEFVAACATALSENDAVRELRIERMRKHVSHCTWDSTAQKVRSQIEKVLQQREGRRVVPTTSAARPTSRSTAVTHATPDLSFEPAMSSRAAGT
jgi:glycosyltransferase involved in cell wall biosynthesis